MKKLALVLFLLIANTANGQVINHDSISSFNSIPYSFVGQFLIVDRSVGAIIDDGLTCLSYPYATAPNRCKRYLHSVPEFNNVPETWNNYYPRQNWEFYGHSGIAPSLPCISGENVVDCFVRFVDNNPFAYKYVLFMPSYLLEASAEYYLQDMAYLKSRYPNLKVVLATTSLSRGAIQSLSNFNATIRSHTEFPIIDIADIESHDQNGIIHYDNRDGVPFFTSSCGENYPDDGLNIEAIAPQYTRECDGGHPGNPDVGKIRLAKALWILATTLN